MTVYFHGVGSLSTSVTLPFDFGTTSTYLETLSLFWSTLTPTGTIAFEYPRFFRCYFEHYSFTLRRYGVSTLTCQTTDLVQVFLLPGSNFNSFGSYTIEFSGCSASQTIIIDVSGTDITVSPNSFFTFNLFDMREIANGNTVYGSIPVSQVVFNFYEATTISIQHSPVVSTILAPLASMLLNISLSPIETNVIFLQPLPERIHTYAK